MTQLSRVPITWSGGPVVGGGFTVLHCSVGDEHSLMTAFRTFLNGVTGNFPTTLTWSFPPAGPIINQETGELEGSWSDGAAPASLSGLSANTWVNGVGLRVKWTTGFFHNGHQIVGASFMVPLQINAYEGSGNIVATNLTQFQTAGNTFAGTLALRIWSRGRTTGDGVSAPVSGCVVPDKVSWLRGRRT